MKGNMISLIKKIKGKISYELDKRFLNRYILRKEIFFNIKILKSLNIKNKSNIIVLFSPRENRKMDFYNKLYLIFAKVISDMGYTCSFLTKNHLYRKYFPQFSFNGKGLTDSIDILGPHQLAVTIKNGQLDQYYRSLPKLKFKWNIDYENKIIEGECVNFYDIILSTIRTVTKSYNINFHTHGNQQILKILIKNCDQILDTYLNLIKYAELNKVKLLIVGWEVNYIPNGVFLIINKKLTSSFIEVIDLDRSYMHYFTSKRVHNYITGQNCTKQNTSSRGDLNSMFIDKIRKIEVNSQEYSSKIYQIMNSYKKKWGISQKQNIEKINNYTKGNIFVLFSHVFWDTAIFDYSNCFPDGMCQWIDETIEYFKRKDDLLILKPHPHEKNLGANETLCSYINSKYSNLPENIILLNSDNFTTGELIDKMTCGLIWRSSVGLELICMGIPCIITGNPLYKGIDLIYAKNKEDYFNLIDNAQNLRVTEASKKNVCQYFYYMENLQSIEFRYCKNSGYGIIWDYKEIRKFLKYGDKELDKIALDII